MPASPSRRRLLVGLALAGLVVTGALLSMPLAERRALQAEERYVVGRLEDASCLTDWGTNEGAGPSQDATVTALAPGGLRVAVTLPYAYTTETARGTVYADTASEAVWTVGATGTTRVRGSDVSPC